MNTLTLNNQNMHNDRENTFIENLGMSLFHERSNYIQLAIKLPTAAHTLLKILIGNIKRHRILPNSISKQGLVGTVVVHDYNLAIRLESVVEERALILKAVHSSAEEADNKLEYSNHRCLPESIVV